MKAIFVVAVLIGVCCASLSLTELLSRVAAKIEQRQNERLLALLDKLELADSSAEDFTVTAEQLMAIMPHLNSKSGAEYFKPPVKADIPKDDVKAKANHLLPYLNAALKEGNINTCPRVAAFLGQISHESGHLKYWEEIASGEAYEGRAGLGNTQPGDGKRYKGRGPVQLTGRVNYQKAGKALGLPLEENPTMVSDFSVGFRTTVYFWVSHKLNELADENTPEAYDKITKRINGALNGKAERDGYYKKAKEVLGC